MFFSMTEIENILKKNEQSLRANCFFDQEKPRK